MRPDQLVRLNDLSEKLADAFLTEADPDEWAGGSKPPAELTQKERGDRYWDKKNAMATGGVLRYTIDLLNKHDGEPEDHAADADMEKKIRDAEKRAAKAVNDAITRAKKPIVAKKG